MIKKIKAYTHLLAFLAAVATILSFSEPVLAIDDGARAYWKGRDGTQVVSFQYLNWDIQASGSQQFDPAQYVYANADTEARVFIGNWARHMTLRNRPSSLSVAIAGGNVGCRMLAGRTQSPRTSDDWLGWELFGNRAIRQGDWKISWLYQPLGTEDWQLFNLAEDPAEQYDLSAKFPQKKKALVALWNEYVKTNGVTIGERSPLEGAREALRDPVPEFDNYPPVRGMEALPYEKLLELMGGKKKKDQ